MREMKDSDEKWLGVIPTSWQMRKGKYIFTQRSQRGNNIELQLLSPTQKYGVIPQSLYEKLSGMNAVKLDEKTDLTLLKTIHKGDYCISLRSFQGGFEYSEYEGVVSPAYQVFYAIDKIDEGYYKYLFKDREFINKMNSYTMSLRDGKNIAYADFGNTYIPYPTYEEQKKIADFLDKKCSEIDTLTSDIQKQIDTLEQYKKSVITEAVTKGLNPDAEMKDSGVEWIGRIPVSWEIKKVKYVCENRNEKYTESKGILDYFALENIESWNSRYIHTDNEYDLSGANLCYKGDVVFGKLRPYLAKTYLVPYDRCCSSEFAIFCNFKGYAKYFLYSFTSEGFVKTVDNSTAGVKMPRANIEFIKNVKIAVPSYEEQIGIANFLDEKCSEIDTIISDKKKQLEVITEYKRSLIYEYVTGKKEVM